MIACPSQDLEGALAEALQTSITKEEETPAIVNRLTDKASRGRSCLKLVPDNGPRQQSRQEHYSNEILSLIIDDENDKAKQEDGFAVDVPTGLERGLGWVGAGVNLIAYSMTIAIFSLPHSAAVLGIVPFTFLVLLFQYVTWYTGLAYIRLQARYPGLASVPDAVHLIYGDAGRSIMSALQLLFSIMLSAQHIILGAQALRTLGWNSCAIYLNVVFSVLSFICTLPRSYRLFARLAFVSVLSVISCMAVVCISAGVNGPHYHIPQAPKRAVKAFGSMNEEDSGFVSAMLAITNLLFSFGAHPCFFPLMGEMRYPHHFRRSLLLLIGVQTTTYLVMTGLLLGSLGQYVTSPIVASLSPKMQRICYILVLPALIISGCSSGQVSAKQLYIVALRRMSRTRFRRSTTWLIWLLINVITWTASWMLAEIVPFFGSFMAVETSLIWVLYLALGSVFVFFVGAGNGSHTWKKYWSTTQAFLLILLCAFMCVAGLYSAAVSIIRSYRSKGVMPFSCSVPAS